ncbi:10925_t:CDS:2 [Dentiscutata erythropus]|uniref:Uricase n=1 Tax=Dentiscutata erythropus TaxID=1348616 RepID=A0A9N8Z0U5_9GLOM|nr:10925_t:CDS:2 [Dentiscutata erythropus]
MSKVYLKEQEYGKENVRLAKVIRKEKWHEIIELTVRVLLDGEFESSYTKADNSMIIATDSMKNTIYILAKQSSCVEDIEIFASEIGQHFITTYSHVHKATISITKHKWTRMLIDGKLHDHSFLRDGEDVHDTKVVVSRKGITIESGLKNLLVLKTTGSAFHGFLRDKFTTLQETDDRILSTSIDATWNFNTISTDSIAKIPFNDIFESIKQITLHTFATDNSASVQATLFLMAKNGLEKHSEIESIRYELPNKHYFTYDLERFGLKNTGKDSDIFVPVSDPAGLITATVARVKE